jgi:hypothetical protein
MDDIVKPRCASGPTCRTAYGWLALDARGDWYMRDDRIQAPGGFASGSRAAASLLHDKLLGFIHRNYAADEAGQWFFQNGPQRVYVELEAAPWVWRVGGRQGSVSAHTGRPAQVLRAWLTSWPRCSCAPTSGLWPGAHAGRGAGRRRRGSRPLATAAGGERRSAGARGLRAESASRQWGALMTHHLIAARA